MQVQLPAWLDERLEVFRRLLAVLTVELDAATAALEAAAPAVRPKGLGGLTYEVIEREVGDWGRFANRRQVASYTGLCGGVSASGQSHHLLSITKHGNVRLRTALVELAWRLVIWQRECKLVKKWWPVLGQAQSDQSRAQESHRGHRPPTGRGLLALAHRQGHAARLWAGSWSARPPESAQQQMSRRSNRGDEG